MIRSYNRFLLIFLWLDPRIPGVEEAVVVVVGGGRVVGADVDVIGGGLEVGGLDVAV